MALANVHTHIQRLWNFQTGLTYMHTPITPYAHTHSPLHTHP